MSSTGRVLLVDDDLKVLRLLEATLRLKDYDVVKVESAKAALIWLRAEAPDLIISDVVLPDMDGFDLLRRVRSAPRGERVPFIFLSARSEPEDVVRGLKLGADEFLRKPFSIDELLLRVQRVLDRPGPGADRAPAARGAGRGSFDGDVELMGLPDVIRMLSVQRRTGVLRVEGPDAGGGAVRLVDGQAVHATLGLMAGEGAFFQILLCEKGRFAFRPGDALEGDTIAVQTLPLLMEALRLAEIGVLRRIDPRNGTAVLALGRLVDARRRDVAPLAAITDLDEKDAVSALTRPVDRPRPSRVDDSDDGAADFRETIQVDVADIALGDEDSLPGAASTGEARPAAAGSVEAAGGGPRVLSAPLPARADVDESWLDPDGSAGIDSIEMAPAFVTGEIEAIEEELGLRSPRPGKVVLAPELAGEPASASEPQATGRIFVTQEVNAVALVEDTAYEMPVLKVEAAPASAHLMDLYEALSAATRTRFHSRQVQLGTRSGRVIASSIQDERRRGTVAAFSAQAIEFAPEDPSGLQFAVLDAGELHVVVVEADHLRLFTILFDRQPDPEQVLAELRPIVSRWRDRSR